MGIFVSCILYSTESHVVAPDWDLKVEKESV